MTVLSTALRKFYVMEMHDWVAKGPHDRAVVDACCGCEIRTEGTHLPTAGDATCLLACADSLLGHQELNILSTGGFLLPGPT